MSNPDHLELLRRGAAVWNAWRAEHDAVPDLSEASLRGLELSRFDLSRADLRGADLRGVTCYDTNFSGAHLEGADLAGAFLFDVRFLNCAQLIVAREWQLTFRDDALACGAAIPERRA